GEAQLPWQIVWISAYRAGAMTLERYRHGRIVFAGNAAHALPIFGVRGLNSGFEDAYNLGWKLAAVLQGWAAPGLLDSYDAERLHAFRVNAAAAIQSTEFMAPPSRGFSLMREAALTLAHRHPDIAQLANPRQTSAIAYDDSPLNADGDAGPAQSAPGAPLPESPVRGPAGVGHLSDAMGPHWTALVFSADAAVSPQLDRELRRLERGPVPFRTVVVARRGEPRAGTTRIRLCDPDGRTAPAFGDGVWLVRPDAHVAGRWLRPAPAQLRDALARAVAVAAIDAGELDRV
ncbi:MAG TPA: FAD-dependent monooxygenase, partial [Burkholderiaceae bacterium]|nr:FAD-dependent monooxygenase [Burkholderiaceae bacterium]